MYLNKALYNYLFQEALKLKDTQTKRQIQYTV